MTAPALRNLSRMNVLVLHAPDADGELLVQHLSRMGCRVQTIWPASEALLAPCDVAIIAVDRDHHRTILPVVKGLQSDGTAVIAVVDYENPATLQLVLELGASAVIAKPIRLFGMLTTLLLSSAVRDRDMALRKRIAKLENRIATKRKVASAINILIELRQVTEHEAYHLLREQAMSQRISMDQVAASILQAHQVLKTKSSHM